MKNKAAIYVRVSTKGQDTKRQIQDLQKLAEQKGWDVVCHINETISGAAKNEDRAGVQEILAMARKGEINKLLVQ